MRETETLTWSDGRGKRVSREFKQTIDIRDHLGTPFYSSLLIAANTHLSVAELEMYLDFQARETPGVARSSSWIQRRRWLHQQPGHDNGNGPKRNRDGKDERAIEIMREHPTISVRNLTLLLAEGGIDRSREWVRQRRCD